MGLTQITTGGVDDNINIDGDTLKVDGVNNRVGVGITPTAPLHVSGTIQSQTGSTVAQMFTDGGAAYFTSVGSYPMLFQTNGNERMRIDSSGRVLIGTTTEGQASADNFTVADSGHCGITIRSGTTSEGAIYFSDGTSGDAEYRGQVHYDHDGDKLRFSTAANTRVLIDGSGRVGIGDTGPGQKLVVKDAGSATTSCYINVISGNGSANAGIAFGDTDADLRGGVLYNHSDDALRFFKSGFTEAARIDSSGRLLVGLSSTADSVRAKIASRNDVSYASTEFEDDATLLLNNEQNNNSAVLVFHSNNSAGSSGRSAIVGGTVNNVKGRLGFYGSCINKDSTTDADVTIDADGRLLVGNISPEGTDSTLETFKSSGQNHLRITSDSLANGEYCMFRAHADTSGGSDRIAYLGVYKHSGITNPAPFVFLEAESGSNAYYWTDNSGNFRTSGATSHLGTTSGTVVGTQTSDLRLKNIGANVSYGLAEVKQLQPKQYALKTDPDVNKLGFIAQEVESIIPEAVFDTNEELDGHQEGNRTKLGMEYVQLIPVLVNAIKELSAEVDTLKAKVAALEAAE